jgi:ferric enterobactin receptor
MAFAGVGSKPTSLSEDQSSRAVFYDRMGASCRLGVFVEWGLHRSTDTLKLNLRYMRQNILAPLLVATLWLSLPPAGFGQSRDISGTVRDTESGEALPYATILIIGTSTGTATNVDGHFVLVGVPTDSLTLRVSYIGFESNLVGVMAGTSNVPGLQVELSSSLDSFEEVTVVAEQYSIMRTAEAVSQVSVSPRDLAVLPHIGDTDIFRSLQLLPGISGTNEAASGLFVRGGTPDQNLVLLDGMTMYHVDHFFGFFSAFNADAIKDVQVYKGGYPAQFGGRTSSVVELTGKSGNTNKPHVGVGLNMLNASAVAEVPIGDKGSILVSGRRSFTDVLESWVYTGIYETLTGDDITPDATDPAAGAGGGPGGGGRPGGAGGGFRQPPGGGGALGAGIGPQGQAVVQPNFYFYDVNAKATYRPTTNDVIGVSVYTGADNVDKSRIQDREITGGNQVNAFQTIDLGDVTNWGNTGISGKWSRQWGSRLFSNGGLAYSQYFSDYLRSTDIERFDTDADSVTFSRSTGSTEDNDVNDLTALLDNQWQVSRTNKIQFGAQFTQSDVSYNFVRDDTLQILNEQQSATTTSVYLQDQFNPMHWITLTGGLRSVYYTGTEQTFIEPRASIGLNVTNRIRLKGAYGQFTQFVARVVNENLTEGARDFWLLADGETVGVQDATHYIAGISYETPAWLFDVEAYHKDLRGLSEFTLRFQRSGVEFAGSDLFYDGTGESRGIEFLLQRKTGRLTGWVSYTLAQAENTFEDLNDGQPFAALHDQRHELKLVSSLRLSPRLNVSGTWAFGTGRPYTSPESQYFLTLLDGAEQSYIHVGGKNGERLPNYHRLDASVHYRFPIGSSRADFGLSVFNLYNSTNVWYKEFDLSETPVTVTDVNYLGFTPNVSFRIDF